MRDHKQVNLILIGIGPHSKRIYLPVLNKYSTKYNLKIRLCIDLKEKEDKIQAYLHSKGIDLNMLYIKPFNPAKGLPKYLEKFLNKFARENNICGVIIATEPLCHVAYAKWALSQGLNILMDKPISTRRFVISNLKEAERIYTDYAALLKLYRKLQKKKNTTFSINVQRRYHLGYQKVMELIKEVAEKFDAPVTSIQSMHSDGQWRMPSEIVSQIYHPYCQGYGKCSHSGYHIFDIAYQYYKAGRREGKYANSAEVMTSFVQARGF